MIVLSSLTTEELAQVDTALNVIDAALDMLLQRRVVTEADGVDLVELGDAVAVEIEARDTEDASYKVEQAARRGECRPARRPDGQICWEPT